MATAKPNAPPAERIALYEKLVALFPSVERKGQAMPYTSVNGHMFSFLDAKGSLALRLPREERERFLAKHGTDLFVAHGTVLKEYVTVPDELLRRPAGLKAWFTMSLDYVSALKPKPTTRSKAKKK